jgi:nucleoside-triphosphatase THEP1
MVSGILTEEVRTAGVRTGFKVRNLSSGEEGWLASTTLQEGPRIGNYRVNTRDLEKIGAMSLENAARGESPLVLIDEVGPMEMTSAFFRRALKEVLMSHKTIVASVKYGSRYAEIEEVSHLATARTITISHENRDQLFPELTSMIDKSFT